MSYFGDAGFCITSSSNTTTTPLGSSSTYTGTAELNDFDSVGIDVRTDADCTIYMEFSVDGSNWTAYPVAGFKCGASSPVIRVAAKLGRYFRLKIENDTSAQTFLRAYTYFGSFRQLDAALNQSIPLDFSGMSTRPTISQDEIIRGLRGGVNYVSKFGYRTATSAGAGEQTLWADNSNITIMTSVDTFDITYNNATDGAATTGALVLLVDYLDGNFELQQATHVLGGTGTDTTAFSGLGVNRAVVVSSGTANYNTNDITIADTTGGNTQAFIPATDSITQQLVYHFPINTSPIIKKVNLTAARIGGGSNPRVGFFMRVYNRLVETEYKVRLFEIDTNATTEFSYDIDIPVSGRDVVYFTADTNTNNTAISGSFFANIYDTV